MTQCTAICLLLAAGSLGLFIRRRRLRKAAAADSPESPVPPTE